MARDSQFEIVDRSFNGLGSGCSCHILGNLPSDLPDHTISMIPGGCDGQPGAGIADAMAIEDRELSGGHDHLQRPLLDVFNGQAKSVANSRISFARCQDDVTWLKAGFLTAGASQSGFPYMAAAGCFQFNALRPIYFEDSLQMPVSEDLQEAAWLDDLLSQSKHGPLPVTKDSRARIPVQCLGLHAEAQGSAQQAKAGSHARFGPDAAVFCSSSCLGQIRFSLSSQRASPSQGHAADGSGSLASTAMEGVFQATVNDSLGPDGLACSQGRCFHKGCLIAQPMEVIQQPEPCGTTAEDQYVKPVWSSHRRMLVQVVPSRQAHGDFGYPHLPIRPTGSSDGTYRSVDSW